MVLVTACCGLLFVCFVCVCVVVNVGFVGGLFSLLLGFRVCCMLLLCECDVVDLW